MMHGNQPNPQNIKKEPMNKLKEWINATIKAASDPRFKETTRGLARNQLIGGNEAIKIIVEEIDRRISKEDMYPTQPLIDLKQWINEGTLN